MTADGGGEKAVDQKIIFFKFIHSGFLSYPQFFCEPIINLLNLNLYIIIIREVFFCG